MVVVYSFFLSVCLTNTLSAPSSVRELEIFFCGACFPLEAHFQAQGFPLPLEESFAKVMERLCCAAVSHCCSWTAQPGALHASPSGTLYPGMSRKPQGTAHLPCSHSFSYDSGSSDQDGKKSQMWFWCFRSCLLTGEQNHVLLMVKWP